MDQIFVVIPAFNEGKVIGDVVTSVRVHFPNVVVVDDGSSDDTIAMARNAGAVVVPHPFNLGQGAALQTGLSYVLQNGADYIVTFDADGQHDIQDVPKMLEALKLKQVDIVLGSRFLGSTQKLPPLRRLVLKMAVIFTKITAGLQLTDTHNGLRVLSRHAAQSIRIRQDSMADASELLDQIGQMKLKYVEAPVHVIYSEYSLAKGQKLTGAFAILADLFYGRISR